MKTQIAIIISLMIGIFIGSELNKPDLEIYTSDNIYFVEGLTVSNEMDDEVLHFSNRGELKEYIFEISAEKSQKFIWNDDEESIPMDGSNVTLEFTDKNGVIYLSPISEK